MSPTYIRQLIEAARAQEQQHYDDLGKETDRDLVYEHSERATYAMAVADALELVLTGKADTDLLEVIVSRNDEMDHHVIG